MIKKIKIWSILAVILLFCILIRKVAAQNISSLSDFQTYIQSFGIVGPFFLTAFQAFQVIVPILPGYLGCAAGAAVYGWLVGFICNYIGISVGSIGAYFIARKYGKEVLTALFSEKQYIKWSEKLEKKHSFGRFLFVATLLPLFPDDFLCYFSGAISMKANKFIWIIILGKPWCILAYSLVFGIFNAK